MIEKSRLTLLVVLAIVSSLLFNCQAIVQFKDPPDTCNNGMIESHEDCDGPDVGPHSCQSLGAGPGTLTCTADCHFDFSGCSGQCGNGRKEGTEECDGSDLGGESCPSQSFEGGTLRCNTADCTFDTSQCHGSNVCNDNGICDLANGEDENNCPDECYFTCGDNTCEIGRGEDMTTCPEDCNWIAVSAGEDHSCGLKADGSVWCWGANESGQLGEGSYAGDRWIPAHVTQLEEPVEQISAGTWHTCALDRSGQAYCWGLNSHGQLGSRQVTDSNSPIPVPVEGLGYARDISAGAGFTCATRDLDSAVHCWGRNDHGQLGIGTSDGPDQCVNNNEPCSRDPLPVVSQVGLDRVTAAGGDPRQTHACALEGVEVWCWGSSSEGQTGHLTGTEDASPVRITGILGFNDISAGSGFTCAAHDAGVYCWGTNSRGQLGIGQITPDATLIPQLVPDTQSVSIMSAGREHVCAQRMIDNVVWCWGANDSGQVGDGGTEDRNQPVQVPAPGGGDFMSVSAGGDHTCAAMEDHTIWCWGNNQYGQLGNGGNDNSSEPVQVVEPTCCFDNP